MKTMTVSNIFAKLIAASAVLLFAGNALASPSLQIDIEDGTYVAGTEQSVVTGETKHTVLALCEDRKDNVCLTDPTFTLVIALSPPTSTAGDYGSILVNGTEYDVTGDMVYGVPPIENCTDYSDPSTCTDGTKDGADMGKHSVYLTYYLALNVAFDASDTCGDGDGDYNVQDPGTAGTCDEQYSEQYFDSFKIDASNLDEGFGLHYDLYTTKEGNGGTGDLDILDKAPFSHDGTYDCCKKVPEPGTLALLGIGLLGLGLTRRRKL